MKPLTLLAALLALACENPIDHFTDDPPKRKVIDCGEITFTDDVDAPADTFAVSNGKCQRTDP
jgi:hypothetical protein